MKNAVNLNGELSFMKSVDGDVSLLVGTIIAMSIAVLGGAVNWLRNKHKKDWWTFIAAIITAVFTGLLETVQ